jgi:hypothetical protein
MPIYSAIQFLSSLSNKMRIIFEKFNDTHVKHHCSAERLADDKIIVLFKGKVIFKEYIPMKQKSFGIKLTH